MEMPEYSKNTSLDDMYVDTFSLHKIEDAGNIPFSAIEYSKFKFGDKKIAKRFGFALAQKFIEDVLKKQPIVNQIVVCSSPYCFIPTATFAMKDYFIQVINSYLFQAGFDVVEETKIHRTITYKEDYGDLSAEDRLKLIGNDTFHIDKEFIEGKTLLFLDDIRITGSHERALKRMAKEYNLINDMLFLYFAELINPQIHPRIENKLNYAFVKTLLDLDKVIKNENFLINTRVVKFILGYQFDDFKNFIEYQSMRLIQNIYHQAIGNGYYKIDDYKRNLTYIQTLLNNKL
jgi:hypothetical protein